VFESLPAQARTALSTAFSSIEIPPQDSSRSRSTVQMVTDYGPQP
jgi:hypothetical protein